MELQKKKITKEYISLSPEEAEIERKKEKYKQELLEELKSIANSTRRTAYSQENILIQEKIEAEKRAALKNLDL